MITNLRFFLFCFLMLYAGFALAQSGVHIRFGSNWAPIDTSLLADTNYQSWDGVFDTYHNTNLINSLTPWFNATHSSNKLVYTNRASEDGVYKDTLYRFSGSERMLYQAVHKSLTFDSANYYFTYHGPGENLTDTVGNKYWEIDEGPPGDSVILSDNEYSAGWKSNHPVGLRLVAKLHVDRLPDVADTARDSAVITIVLKAKYGGDTSSRIVGAFPIKWSSFDSTGDQVMFSLAGSVVLPGNLNGGDSRYSNGLELEVHSRRYVTAYIAWVCVEDSNAHLMLAGIDLDPSDSALRAVAESVRLQIRANVANIRSAFGPKMLKFYTADEPAHSQWAAQGWLRDQHYVGDSLVTEFEGDDDAEVKQFLTQTKANIIWRYVGGIGGGVCAYADTGLDGTLSGRIPLDDTTHTGYTDATMNLNLTPQWGYFPHDSGPGASYWTPQKMAMDSSYGLWRTVREKYLTEAEVFKTAFT